MSLDELIRKKQQSGDIDEGESTWIKSFLSMATDAEKDLIAKHFPLEYDEWAEQSNKFSIWNIIK